MLSICVPYKKEESLKEWRDALPLNGVQIVACQTVIDENATEIKKEVLGKTEELIVLQITFPTMENHFDFSMVRNFIDKHATGDWLLHIDSDERLAIPEHEFWDIYKTINASDADCAFVSIAGISQENEPTDLYRQRYNIPSIRLHRKSSNLLWKGICHETIDIVERDVTVADTDILLYHQGYAIPKEDMLAKCERNARLMIREYTRVGSPRNWNYLVNTFALIHKFKR